MRPWFLPFLLAAACNAAQSEPATSGSAGKPSGLVVLELFTSQGCSSCPPADRLLTKLAAAGTLANRQVVPLSFHVDYWNDLGWADPFSHPLWSQRQRAYASSLGERGVYTPQVVVSGTAHAVGSDRSKLEKLVRNAPSTAELKVAATWSGEAVQVKVADAAPAGTELWIAVWQDGLDTAVKRGENRGEALHNDHVVRRLARLSPEGAAVLRLDPSWRNLGGLVFAQRSSDRAVVAAGLLPKPAT
jgi:hypothetical protein